MNTIMKVILPLSSFSLVNFIVCAVKEEGAMQVACVFMAMLMGFVSSLCIGSIASESKKDTP